MLTIYCGDDTIRSRESFVTQRARIKEAGGVLYELDVMSVDSMIASQTAQHSGLFGETVTYETTNLIRALRKKYSRKTKEIIRQLAQVSSYTIIDWEDTSTYELGIDKDRFTFVKEYKLRSSTFSILPLISPDNRLRCVRMLDDLTQHQPIEVTFAMILRHVRLMLALVSGYKPKDNPFLVKVAQSTASLWTKPQLMTLYKRLLRVDVNVKTGRNTPLTMREQLEYIVVRSL